MSEAPAPLARLVTVVVLTLNEADRIQDLLACVPSGVAVVVVDSGSGDGTPDVARSLGCEVVHMEWRGFASQRNAALSLASVRTPWVLFLDADERPDPRVWQWMHSTLSSPLADSVDGWYLPSRLILGDAVLRHAPGYPILHLRLAHRERTRFVPNHGGHGEAASTETTTAVAPYGYDHHFMSRGLISWLHKHIELAVAEAQARPTGSAQLTRRGRLSAGLRIGFLRVPTRFIYHYIVRGGFRDGRAGLRYAALYAWFEATKELVRSWEVG